jgi:hypothetical protein
MQASKHVEAAKGTVVAFPFFKDLVIILGFSAILINSIMCIVYVVTIMAGKFYFLQKWLVVVNFIFLLVQFYFFFL